MDISLSGLGLSGNSTYPEKDFSPLIFPISHILLNIEYETLEEPLSHFLPPFPSENRTRAQDILKLSLFRHHTDVQKMYDRRINNQNI